MAGLIAENRTIPPEPEFYSNISLNPALIPSPSSSYNVSTFECEIFEMRLAIFNDALRQTPDIKIAIIISYITVALIGGFGNAMVIIAVLQNPAMRTLRNYFILMLAISDFIMCSITVPFTMKLVLVQFWDLGSVACKIVSSFQAINIFVSTMSLTAISLDRYFLIIFPFSKQAHRKIPAVLLTVIWGFALLMATPMLIVVGLDSPLKPAEAISLKFGCEIELWVCTEFAWPSITKQIYTVFCFLFQYFLPLISLIFLNAGIRNRLKKRNKFSSNRSSGLSHNNRKEMSPDHQQDDKNKRVNYLIIAIIATFAATWLPLNVYFTLVAFELAQYKLYIFAACHVIGMFSACANPVLYGVFNENFRREFVVILKKFDLLIAQGRVIKRRGAAVLNSLTQNGSVLQQHRVNINHRSPGLVIYGPQSNFTTSTTPMHYQKVPQEVFGVPEVKTQTDYLNNDIDLTVEGMHETDPLSPVRSDSSMIERFV